MKSIHMLTRTGRMAHRMLKDAGYSLPWIDERREIETDTDNTRRSLTPFVALV